jgi:hypothetical protein
VRNFGPIAVVILDELLRDRRPNPLRRSRHIRHFLLTGLALAAALVLAACGGGGGGSSSKNASVPPLHAGRVGPQSMFTLGGDLTDPAATVQTLAQLGVQSVHLYVGWSSIAPDPTSFHKPSFDATDPNAYPATGWAPYDAMIQGLTASHIAVNLSLTGKPPFWAEGPGDPKRTTEPEWKPNVADYKQWVIAVGRRYSGHFTPAGAKRPLPRIDFWSGWNEPNIGINLAPETTHSGSQIEVAPRVYRGLLNAFWSALHATGHGKDRILIGELAPIGATTGGQPGLFSSMVPFRFLRALYCVNTDNKPLTGKPATVRGCPATPAASKQFAAHNPALFHGSGFALHPYAFSSLPPDTPLPNTPDDAELAALPKAISLIDSLQRVYGSHTRFPIWLTEYGYITNPPNDQYTVSPKQAGLFLNWAQYIVWSDPRIKSNDQYLLNDPPTHAPFATGLRTATGKEKPSFAAYRMPLYLPVSKGSKGTPLLVWGQVRPAPAARRSSGKVQVATMQFQAKGSKAFKTVGQVHITNPNGYFEVHQSFPSSGSLRIKWSYPHGPTVFSRSAPVSIG